MKVNVLGDKVKIYLSGRIDSANAYEREQEVFDIIGENAGKAIIFDMSELAYISSAGLRILLKVKKSVKDEVILSEVCPNIYEILETTGFTELFLVKKKMREVSIDGLDVIGKGFYGTVYRIDSDKIIKVYESADAIDMIENERNMARLAFLNGLPTAISYDIVKVGNSYGSVFELLNAKTFNDLIIENPGNIDELVRLYVDLMKQIHATEISGDKIPSAKAGFIDYIRFLKEYLDESIYIRIMNLFDELKEDNHLIHGDIQMKNVMMVDGEPMLIDMDTLSKGKPIFELAGLYVTYRAFEEDDPGNSMSFLGISDEMSRIIWNKVIRCYYDNIDEEELDRITDKIRIVASIRFLYIVCSSDLKNGELGKIRIEHTKEHLRELIERVDTLN
ncbi:MAG: STAS domain-containing protein [Eubacterium sp.]|nr:STAS domain-containing protein [Eubacterium sp.]